MEKLMISQLLLTVVDIVIIVLSTDCLADGYTINGRWLIEKQSNGHESSRLCSDIIQVTRKLLENNLIRDVIYPKLTEDGMFGKSTKIIETRTPSRRNVVHFPSNKYYPVDSPQRYNHLQQFNRSENSRFKRQHGLQQSQSQSPPPLQPVVNQHDQQQKLFHHHFPKIGSTTLTSQTIKLVPLNDPFEETGSMDVNRSPQAYIVDLSSLNEAQSSVAAESIDQMVDGSIDLTRQVRPRYYADNGNGQDDVTLERRQDDAREEDQDTGGGGGDGESETKVDSRDPNVVKKTFGYKVTLYKSPNIQEPQILTEEFFGEGKKKKVIKILKKDENQLEGQKSRSEQLSQQSSSSSGRYIPQFVTAPVGTVDQNDEDELEANRKLLGSVRKQLANEKGIEATRTISKSGDEKQHDKKGAKEKALREKTQIEFFEREKIFSNDDRYGKQKLDGQQQPPKQIIQHEFPIMQDRPEIVRLTTQAPDPPGRDRDSITVVTSSPDEINNNNDGNAEGMDFQSLHDLLLKRLKGWREKGYKITTELEIVQRGAVHDKERSVRERGKGQQTFQRYERGGAFKGKPSNSYSGSTINDNQGFGQIEPLSVTHVSPDSDRPSHTTMKAHEGQKTKVNEDEETQGNIFSSLPKFLLDPPDYEAGLDGPNGQKIDPIMELVNQQDPRHQLQLQPQSTPPHHLVHSPPHHHHTVLLHHHHQQSSPPPLSPPEAMKLVQPNQMSPPKASRLVSINNTTNGSTTRPIRKGRKYSFKGMTRKIPSTQPNESGHNNHSVHDDNLTQMNKNREKVKVTSSTPISLLFSDKSEDGNINNNNKNGVKSKTLKNKPKDEQSSRRLAAQKRLKAKAKQKAKLQQQLQQKQYQNQIKQQQKLQQQQQHQHQQQNQLQQKIKPSPQSVSQSRKPNNFQSPMSIQDQILYPASPLVGNSARGITEGLPTPPSGSVDLTNPLSFLDGVHESLYMPTENGFDDISFGNPTLITLPGLLDDSHNDEPNNPLNEHFRSFLNQGSGGGGNSNLNDGKKNFLNFQDLTEPEKKHPRPNSITFEDPLNSFRAPPSPPHTEILIGKPAPTIPNKLPPHQLNSLTSTGQYSNNNNKVKMRDYPTSIQDITRGKKMGNNYGIEPGFGRESPDNLILPGKEVDPLLNHFKNDLFNNVKLSNDWPDQQQGLTMGNNGNNQADKPNTVNWLHHEDLGVNLMKNNPRSTVHWDLQTKNQHKQPKLPNRIVDHHHHHQQQQQLHGLNHQTNKLIVNNNNNYLEGNQGSIGYSTEKPMKKQKLSFILDEPLELIPGSPKEVKPGDYRQSIWAEPEIDKIGKKRNKNRKKKNKVKGQQNGDNHNHNQNHHQQQQQLTEEIFSVGFDSQRMRTPKNAVDLISRSSQIYPLIGGYSPFIIPSTTTTQNDNISVEPEIDSEIDSHLTDDQDDDQHDEISANDSSYLNHDQTRDNNQLTDQQIINSNINNNGDDRRRKFNLNEKDEIDKLSMMMMNINNNYNVNVNYPPSLTPSNESWSDLDQDSSSNQLQKLINNNHNQTDNLSPKDKIDEVKSNQQINHVNTTKLNESGPLKGITDQLKSPIWSQPCPTCPEF